MGYDLQVTRKEFYGDEEGLVITAAEWLALIRSDPTLRLDGKNGPYFVVWLGPNESQDWIDYDEDGGYLFSESPSDEGVDKLIELAHQLNAKVQGQDGEVYGDNWRSGRSVVEEQRIALE